MTALRPVPPDPEDEPQSVGRNLIPMPVTNMVEPSMPTVEVRRSGPLGIFSNTKDQEHQERLIDQEKTRVEITWSMQQATYAEIHNVKTIRDGALAAQHILDTTPNIPFAVEMVKALGARFGSRSLQRFDNAGAMLDEFAERILRRGRWG
jgi:hypothetical protein